MSEPPKATGPSKRVQWLARGLPIGVLALAIASVPVMMLSREGLPRLRTLKAEHASVDRENQELRRDIETLRVKVKKLREEPAAVERLARDELGMVRQSEVVFHFPE